MQPILVTGVAGFIGFHLARRLLNDGAAVLGVDVVNAYYDVQLKQDRLAQLEGVRGFHFVRQDLADREGVRRLFQDRRPAVVLHMAGQAGVRYSLENPAAYIDSNIVGFQNVLEGCREVAARHLIYASSSSVYGANRRMPFSEQDGAAHPVSLYAATKRANELQAHSYSHLFRLPTTGLRFFTVYGPWGRPDMALFLFTRAILEGRPIDVFNHGRMRRDFTYVSDIVEGIVRLVDRPATAEAAWNPAAPDPATSAAPFRLYNIGNSRPVELDHLIGVLEKCIGRPAVRNNLPMQPGDVLDTYADVTDLERAIGYRPTTSIEEGVKSFVEWYRGYYKDGG